MSQVRTSSGTFLSKHEVSKMCMLCCAIPLLQFVPVCCSVLLII
jgi:hypothetical protein